MIDGIYRVIRQNDDSFNVAVTRAGDLPQTATGFATEAEADAWIARDERIWDSDPLRTPAYRRRCER
jgi:hypothetical protein